MRFFRNRPCDRRFANTSEAIQHVDLGLTFIWAASPRIYIFQNRSSGTFEASGACLVGIRVPSGTIRPREVLYML